MQRTPKLVHRAVVTALFIGLAGAPTHADRIELPDLGDPSESVLSIAKEKEIGQQMMLQINTARIVAEDIIVQEYISSLGHELVAQADSTPHDFNFFVIKQSSINAFALPGGYIGMNAGLITTTESESELAAVVAHEISHVTQRHIARAFFHQAKMRGPMIAAILAGILAGKDAARPAITAASAGAAQAQINFTRKNEYEADRVGIDLLGRSGFDPYGMATIFEKMQRQAKLYGNAPPEFLSTHPVHGSRISDAKGRAGNYPRSRRSDSERYRIVKARLRVLMEKNPTQVATDLSQILKDQRSADKLMDQYALTFALMEAGKLREAERQSDQLLQQDRFLFYISLQRADLDMHAGRDQQALQRLDELRAAYPSDHVLTLEYTRLLIQAGQALKAKKMLEDYLDFRQGDPAVYRLLSHASQASGDNLKSHTYMAEAYRIIGDIASSVSHLEKALNLAQNHYEKAELEARLVSLRGPEEENKKEKKNERKY